MIFGGIQKLSTIDYPRVLSCVLFTVGCDFDCFYCHNRELIHGSSNTISEEEVMDFLRKRKGLIDGVVISGGEPTIQNDLAEFIERIRSMGFLTKLDTNGMHPDVVKNLLDKKLVDYYAVDIKALPCDYNKVCGISGFDNVKTTVELLSKSRADYEVRTTLYPELTLSSLKELLASFPVQQCWRLNFFRQPEKYKEDDLERLSATALTKKDIEANLSDIKSIQPNLNF